MKISEGARFGRLVALRASPPTNGRARWVCRCDCGAEKSSIADNLKAGLAKGCGCRMLAGNTVHGMFGTREYQSWAAMIQRTANPKNPGWKNYGGRGITVCAAWADFNQFLRDMGMRPAKTSIDRIDVNGNYEPGNCRWADAKTQANNKRHKT